MAIQPRNYIKPSFFEHLNYDVRQIIYRYMENHLPPVSNSNEYMGFALTCKQAYLELRQPAVRGLRRFLGNFQRNLEWYAAISIKVIPEIPLHGTFASIQHITILVPPSLVIQSFETQLDKAVVALRPILSGYFRKVTLLFVDPVKVYSPTFRDRIRVASGFALFRLSQIVTDERNLYFSTIALSKYASVLSKYHDMHLPASMQPTGDDSGCRVTSSYQDRCLPHPISTTDIQIAWDWRSEETTGMPATLKGYIHQCDNQATSHSESMYPKLYVLENDDKSVGMQGLVCKQRWSVSEIAKVSRLLQNGQGKSSGEPCWSKGVGREVRHGWDGLGMKESQ